MKPMQQHVTETPSLHILLRSGCGGAGAFYHIRRRISGWDYCFGICYGLVSTRLDPGCGGHYEMQEALQGCPEAAVQLQLPIWIP